MRLSKAAAAVLWALALLSPANAAQEVLDVTMVGGVATVTGGTSLKVV